MTMKQALFHVLAVLFLAAMLVGALLAYSHSFADSAESVLQEAPSQCAGIAHCETITPIGDCVFYHVTYSYGVIVSTDVINCADVTYQEVD